MRLRIFLITTIFILIWNSIVFARTSRGVPESFVPIPRVSGEIGRQRDVTGALTGNNMFPERFVAGNGAFNESWTNFDAGSDCVEFHSDATVTLYFSLLDVNIPCNNAIGSCNSKSGWLKSKETTGYGVYTVRVKLGDGIYSGIVKATLYGFDEPMYFNGGWNEFDHEIADWWHQTNRITVSGQNPEKLSLVEAGINLNEINTFKVVYSPNSVKFYINGKLIRTIIGEMPEANFSGMFSIWAPLPGVWSEVGNIPDDLINDSITIYSYIFEPLQAKNKSLAPVYNLLLK